MVKSKVRELIDEVTDEIKNIDGQKIEVVSEVLSNEDQKAAELSSNFRNFLRSNKYEIGQHNTDSKIIISTGLKLLDSIAGGGIATNFVQLVGNPGSGKSMLASRILAEGQRIHKGKFLCIYVDTENSATNERLLQLGVKNCEIYNKNISVEKILKSIEAMCSFKDENKELINIPSVIVWDSIANTLTDKGMEAEDINSVLGEKARIFSSKLPKIGDIISEYNISLVAVNQLRDKIDIGPVKTTADLRFLSDKQVPGGKSILFNSFQLFHLKAVSDIKDTYGFGGCKVELKSVKNKLFTPNIKIPLIFSYERGFSNFWSNYEYLKENKRINSSAWTTMIGYESDKKFRQYEAIKLYRDDLKFKECFDEHIEDVIKNEIIEKYKSTDFSNVEAF